VIAVSEWSDCDEFDEERALWRPGRRSFLFFGASALVGSLLPPVTIGGSSLVQAQTALVTAVWVTRDRVEYVENSLFMFGTGTA
jgi:hypothetical protein